MSSSNAEDTVSITKRIHQYRAGAISWGDLVLHVTEYPWRAPDLPDSDDWNGWAAIPDTFQAGTFGEVTGAHVDELLTDDEYCALMNIYDALDQEIG